MRVLVLVPSVGDDEWQLTPTVFLLLRTAFATLSSASLLVASSCTVSPVLQPVWVLPDGVQSDGAPSSNVNHRTEQTFVLDDGALHASEPPTL